MDRITINKIKNLMGTLRTPTGINGFVKMTDVNTVLEQFVQPELGGTVPAENFVQTIAANIDNDKLSDKDFREFVRNSLPIVKYKKLDKSWW